MKWQSKKHSEKSNEVVGKQCGGGCRDLSFQWKTEERQKGIVLGIKELETLVSLPLVLCLCKSASLWPFLMTYNTGQDLSPLFPGIWRQIRKKNNRHYLKKRHFAELHSDFTRRMKQRHRDLVQNPFLTDSTKDIGTMNSTSGTVKRRAAPSGQTLID